MSEYRAWAPDCRDGARAFELASALRRLLAGRPGSTLRLFATHSDPRAVAAAREFPAPAAVRKTCVFAQHDLSLDPPFLRLDYVELPEAFRRRPDLDRTHILERIHYALRPTGLVRLKGGRLLEPGGLFAPVKGAVDLYRPVPAATGPALPRVPWSMTLDGAAALAKGDKGTRSAVLVDEDQRVLRFGGALAPFFTPPIFTTKPLAEAAAVWVWPKIQALLSEAAASGAVVRADAPLECELGGRLELAELEVVPVRDPRNPARQIFWVLLDGPREGGEGFRLPAPVDNRDRLIHQLKRELDSSRGFLQKMVLERERDNARLVEANAALIRAQHEISRAHAGLSASEAKYRQIFAHSSDGVVLVDAGSGRVLDANRAALALYGYGRRKMLSLNESDLLAGETGRFHRRKNGTRFPVEVETTPIAFKGRTAKALFVRDLKARLRAESLKRYRAKLEVEESLIGDVSHELRTPVAAIKGFAETLRRGVEDPGQRREFVGTIERHADRLAKLIDRLLALTRLAGGSGGGRERIALKAAAEEAAAALKAKARKAKVKIEIDLPAALAAKADPSDLPHVFENLIDNAIKFNRPGGRVAVGGRAAGKFALITISDTGVGIPRKDLRRVFERFYRGERTKKYEGSGLGLSLVRGMVEASGGRIRAESTTGGSTFHVRLPLAL
jgi:signal transduction histidine kinase